MDSLARNAGTFTQTLKVGDYEGPIVDCPIFTHYCPVVQDSIMMFPTDPFECSATILVPMPEVTDNCSDNWSVITQIVNAQGGVVYTILPGQNRTITGVQIGDYRFRYIVTDECGNTTVKECPFRVADTQEPVAICQGAINISLGAQGLARLSTTSVNLGSYDNCGIATIELRRIFTRNSDCELMPEADWYWSDWGHMRCRSKPSPWQGEGAGGGRCAAQRHCRIAGVGGNAGRRVEPARMAGRAARADAQTPVGT